jgi:hypothetical protein
LNSIISNAQKPYVGAPHSIMLEHQTMYSSSTMGCKKYLLFSLFVMGIIDWLDHPNEK